LQDWFDFKIPRSKVHPDFIADCLEKEVSFATKPTARILWIGTQPTTEIVSKSKRGETWHNLQFTFHDTTETVQITMEQAKGKWLQAKLMQLAPQEKPQTFVELKTDFETRFDDFELFWFSKSLNRLKEIGLLVI
jgi:hypothetical protein